MISGESWKCGKSIIEDLETVPSIECRLGVVVVGKVKGRRLGLQYADQKNL